jgi:hypothetical protein
MLINLLTSRAETLRGLYGDLGGAASGVRKLVQTLPSAEPEERTVKVKEGWGLAMCCACKKRVFPYDKYCSHCGARLEWE